MRKYCVVIGSCHLSRGPDEVVLIVSCRYRDIYYGGEG